MSLSNGHERGAAGDMVGTQSGADGRLRAALRGEEFTDPLVAKVEALAGAMVGSLKMEVSVGDTSHAEAFLEQWGLECRRFRRR